MGLYHVINFKFKFVYLDATNESQTATPKLKKGILFCDVLLPCKPHGYKKSLDERIGFGTRLNDQGVGRSTYGWAL